MVNTWKENNKGHTWGEMSPIQICEGQVKSQIKSIENIISMPFGDPNWVLKQIGDAFDMLKNWQYLLHCVTLAKVLYKPRDIIYPVFARDMEKSCLDTLLSLGTIENLNERNGYYAKSICLVYKQRVGYSHNDNRIVDIYGISF